jgi:hypothetical protein
MENGHGGWREKKGPMAAARKEGPGPGAGPYMAKAAGGKRKRPHGGGAKRGAWPKKVTIIYSRAPSAKKERPHSPTREPTAFA